MQLQVLEPEQQESWLDGNSTDFETGLVNSGVCATLLAGLAASGVAQHYGIPHDDVLAVHALQLAQVRHAVAQSLASRGISSLSLHGAERVPLLWQPPACLGACWPSSCVRHAYCRKQGVNLQILQWLTGSLRVGACLRTALRGSRKRTAQHALSLALPASLECPDSFQE